MIDLFGDKSIIFLEPLPKMNHIMMITGIHTPEVINVLFENLPRADELMRKQWIALSHITDALNGKLHERGIHITAAMVLEALKTLHGDHMFWSSALEHCIDSGNLPTKMGAEIVIPAGDANLLRSIILCNAITGRYEVREFLADAAPPGE